MKRLLPLIGSLALLASPALAAPKMKFKLFGPGSSGGGGGVLCKKPDGTTEPFVMLDYWQATLKKIGQPTPPVMSLEGTEEDVLNRLLKTMDDLPGFKFDVEERVRALGPIESWNAVELEQLADTGKAFKLPPNCDYIQIAIRQDDEVYADPKWVAALAPGQRALLRLHEAIYFHYQDFVNRNDASDLRRWLGFTGEFTSVPVRVTIRSLLQIGAHRGDSPTYFDLVANMRRSDQWAFIVTGEASEVYVGDFPAGKGKATLEYSQRFYPGAFSPMSPVTHERDWYLENQKPCSFEALKVVVGGSDGQYFVSDLASVGDGAQLDVQGLKKFQATHTLLDEKQKLACYGQIQDKFYGAMMKRVVNYYDGASLLPLRSLIAAVHTDFEFARALRAMDGKLGRKKKDYLMDSATHWLEALQTQEKLAVQLRDYDHATYQRELVEYLQEQIKLLANATVIAD